MTKSNKPIITQTELICRAIRSIEDEISAHKNQFGGNPSYEAYLGNIVAEHEVKLNALKQMYFFETGTNY